jgi:hypothetical protein
VTAPNTIRLGLDIGGTFTDVALEAGGRARHGKNADHVRRARCEFDGKHRCEGQKGHTKLVVGCGSKREKLSASNLVRYAPTKRTSMGGVATSLMGRCSRKSPKLLCG